MSMHKKRNKVQQVGTRKNPEKTPKSCISEQHYSLPTCNTESAIEQCKKQVLSEGKLCYCKEKCRCRSCQESKASNERCSLEILQKESVGCALGCNNCSEHIRCY